MFPKLGPGWKKRADPSTHPSTAPAAKRQEHRLAMRGGEHAPTDTNAQLTYILGTFKKDPSFGAGVRWCGSLRAGFGALKRRRRKGQGIAINHFEQKKRPIPNAWFCGKKQRVTLHVVALWPLLMGICEGYKFREPNQAVLPLRASSTSKAI